MGRFFGKIGFAENQQTSPGVWKEVIVERGYYGTVSKDTKRSESGEGVNDDIVVDTIISIISNAYSDQNFFSIKYVNWRGALWKVTKADATQKPRLVLTLGGVYNGPTA